MALELFSMCIFKAGYTLQYIKEHIDEYTVDEVDTYQIHCFGGVVGCLTARKIPDYIIEYIAHKHPEYAFLKIDKNAEEKVIEIMERISPDTLINVIRVKST